MLKFVNVIVNSFFLTVRVENYFIVFKQKRQTRARTNDNMIVPFFCLFKTLLNFRPDGPLEYFASNVIGRA